MDHSLDRIYIINTFKSSFGSSSKSINTRLRNIWLAQVFYGFFLVFCVGATLLSLVLPILGIEPPSVWAKMGVLVIFSLAFLLNQLPMLFYEVEILKHLKILHDKKDYNIDSELNLELLELIRKFNHKKPGPCITILVLLFMGVGIMQMILENMGFWKYFKLPYLMLCGYFIWHIYTSLKKLKKNILEAEKGINQVTGSTNN